MKTIKLLKLTQRKEEVHYETTLWDNRDRAGWYPFLFGFGYSQEEADTNLIKQINFQIFLYKFYL